MENKSSSQVIGTPSAPYETRLARQCGTAKRYAAVGSPSLPNYIGVTSGGIQGIHDDDPPASHRLTVDNIFRQVRATGRTSRSYQESMRTPCQVDAAGDYAPKHNPAAYYQATADRAACRLDNVPLGDTRRGALRRDLDAGTLAAFSFITPNLCHDTHDCSVRTGDQWLAQWLPLILSSGSYRAGRTAVFLVWDEYTPMPLIVMSPTTPSGTVAATAHLDHYALLGTTEDLLGLPRLGRAGQAPSMRAAFHL
jgi:hypothetical protein